MPSIFPVATTKPDDPSGSEHGKAVIPAGSVGELGLVALAVALAVVVVVVADDDDNDDEDGDENDDDGVLVAVVVAVGDSDASDAIEPTAVPLRQRPAPPPPPTPAVPALSILELFFTFVLGALLLPPSSKIIEGDKPKPYISPFRTNLKLFLWYALA